LSYPVVKQLVANDKSVSSRPAANRIRMPIAWIDPAYPMANPGCQNAASDLRSFGWARKTRILALLGTNCSDAGNRHTHYSADAECRSLELETHASILEDETGSEVRV
jgi:hypothetical protein